jgi:hypothetical protein
MFLDFIIRAFLNIQYQASSIGPKNATVSSISAMPVERILCNVRVYFQVMRTFQENHKILDDIHPARIEVFVP